MKLEGSIEEDGFAFIRALINPQAAIELAKAVEAARPVDTRATRGLYAMRRLTERVPAVQKLASSAEVLAGLCALGYQGAALVQAIFFDKTPDANWKVAWHQDLSMPVSGRTDEAGYGPWNEKEGQAYVQPPAEILGTSVILRLHLDDCDESNGPLKVLARSHQSGRMKDEAVSAWPKEAAITCNAAAGDVVVMKPLTLHASSPSSKPAHRRVIHLEYSLAKLPVGLAWQGA